jgi:hypothetical protein
MPALLRAGAELTLARLKLRKLSSRDIAALANTGEPDAPSTANEQPPEMARIAYLVPRVASRLPFRADCVVQALAALHWLASLGYETDLFLGTRGGEGPFEAHAWLTWRGTVVTGGDISAYKPFRRS